MKQFPYFRLSSFATCLVLTMAVLLSAISLWSQNRAEPIIDMHLHAKPADALGPPPLYLCAPISEGSRTIFRAET